MSPANRSLWGWPIVLGLLTASGLLSALVSDFWGDVWSWCALGLPVAVMAWYGLRRDRAADHATAPTRTAVRPSRPPR